jgi:hypothetical protein
MNFKVAYSAIAFCMVFINFQNINDTEVFFLNLFLYITPYWIDMVSFQYKMKQPKLSYIAKALGAILFVLTFIGVTGHLKLDEMTMSFILQNDLYEQYFTIPIPIWLIFLFAISIPVLGLSLFSEKGIEFIVNRRKAKNEREKRMEHEASSISKCAIIEGTKIDLDSLESQKEIKQHLDAMRRFCESNRSCDEPIPDFERASFREVEI